MRRYHSGSRNRRERTSHAQATAAIPAEMEAFLRDAKCDDAVRAERAERNRAAGKVEEEGEVRRRREGAVERETQALPHSRSIHEGGAR